MKLENDFPAVRYEEVYGLAAEYGSGFSEAEQGKFFGENARRFYRF